MISYQEIYAFEKVFHSSNQDNNVYLQHVLGKNPILLMTPFVFGHKIGTENKSVEKNTGVIGLFLNKMTNCHVLYPNFSIEKNNLSDFYSDYYQKTYEINQKTLLKAVIEIKKMPSSPSKTEINFITHNISTQNKKIKEIFYSYGFLNIIENQFLSFHPFVSNHVFSQTTFPFLQLNIHPNLTNPTKDLLLYQFLLESISEIITELGLK